MVAPCDLLQVWALLMRSEVKPAPWEQPINIQPVTSKVSWSRSSYWTGTGATCWVDFLGTWTIETGFWVACCRAEVKAESRQEERREVSHSGGDVGLWWADQVTRLLELSLSQVTSQFSSPEVRLCYMSCSSHWVESLSFSWAPGKSSYIASVFISISCHTIIFSSL